MSGVQQLSAESLRIDSWLWRTRFYKSRSQASAAVSGGRVHLNGQRIKSSRTVGQGDTLQITHPAGDYRITVLGIPARRGPAPEVQACYRQDEFIARAGGKNRGASGGASPAPAGRPDKKSRRSLRVLKGKLQK
jgi:ribosome-associated heat shock protein Hsp15